MDKLRFYDVSSYIIPVNEGTFKGVDNGLFEFSCDRAAFGEKRLFIIPKNISYYLISNTVITDDTGTIIEEAARKIVFYLNSNSVIEIIARVEIGDRIIKDLESYLSRI